MGPVGWGGTRWEGWGQNLEFCQYLIVKELAKMEKDMSECRTKRLRRRERWESYGLWSMSYTQSPMSVYGLVEYHITL